MKKTFLLFLLITLAFSRFVHAETAVEEFHKANIAYQRQDYTSAITSYEKLVKGGHISPEIYYNLGNSYFKTSNVPKAIVNYERARKLVPEDEDVSFNLKIASLKVVDKIEPVPEVFYKRWINTLSASLPSNTWSIFLIVMIWLLFAAAGSFFISRSSTWKKVGFISMITCAALAGFFYIMASRSYADAYEDSQGIITASSVYVKSSPDEKGNDLFILHEGTKVEILDQLNDWKKIRIANGTIGWMKGKELETI